MKNYLIGLFIILIIVIIYSMNFRENSVFTYFKLRKDVKENKEVLDTYKKQSSEIQKNIK